MTASTRTREVLQGGTWNVERDRDPADVADGLLWAFDTFDLDFLALQEFSDYAQKIRRELRSHQLEAVSFDADHHQNAIVARQGLITPGSTRSVDLGGDGWTTADGQHHIATRMTTALLDGWLRVGSVHMPVTVDWTGPARRPSGPADRVDDYTANARALVRFAQARQGTDRGLSILGDWNAHHDTDTGYASPAWIAEQAHLKIAAPAGAPPAGGHRKIDYLLHDDDVTVASIEYRLRRGSDHPLVTVTLRHTSKEHR